MRKIVYVFVLVFVTITALSPRLFAAEPDRMSQIVAEKQKLEEDFKRSLQIEERGRDLLGHARMLKEEAQQRYGQLLEEEKQLKVQADKKSAAK